MMRLFALALVLLAVPHSAAASRPKFETVLAVKFGRDGRAQATVTITNRTLRPICVTEAPQPVYLRDVNDKIVGSVWSNASVMWPDDMPVVWDDGAARVFELKVNTEYPPFSHPLAVEEIHRVVRATYDFEAYDCAKLFADRVHVRPRYRRELSATVTVAQ